MSLSARRAWIEMFSVHEVFANFEVALRKESVDRNIELSSWGGWGRGSLSARRAWIEIDIPPNLDADRASLSARRAWIEILTDDVSIGGKISRSPQGERG